MAGHRRQLQRRIKPFPDQAISVLRAAFSFHMRVIVSFAKNDKWIFSRVIDPSIYSFGDVKSDIAKYLQISSTRIGLKTQIRGKLLRLEESTKFKDIPSTDVDSIKLYFVDLGLQVGYRATYLMEYLSALIPFLLFYLYFERNYSKINPDITLNTRLSAFCWCFHFLKRIYESMYIHKFSRGTMPVYSLLRNCIYYGGFSTFLGFYINRLSGKHFVPLHSMAFVAAFLFFCYCNWECHMLLSSLRKDENDRVRHVPVPNDHFPTYLFNLVSFPNYFYEILTWISFSCLTSSCPSFIFTVCGATIMIKWAKEKHREYLRDPSYPRNRRAIVPYIF
ncbi:putative very-long-chain enoyl-CoA reductase art-1 [Thelohanellus kitauei]|uniref:Putative very-long-chain enoyl-CoA reductase art-1 n=1 Tax=Thelohanellus kitauei TaxID=669202 RepID=A0A0C2NAU2_THEKT|nr:putative very-long-chain enoyl-CoA reductase art-1 [Thelohanellus kitauei]